MTKWGNGLFVGAAPALKHVQNSRHPVSYDVPERTAQGEARSAAWFKCKWDTSTSSFFRCGLVRL